LLATAGAAALNLLLFVALFVVLTLGTAPTSPWGLIRDLCRDLLRDLRSWRAHPFRRHGQLIRALPLTAVGDASPGEQIAVSGRVVRGDPVPEGDPGLVTGQLVLDDGSGPLLEIGRAGEQRITERFALGDLVFAVGELEAPAHPADPFRSTGALARLVPGAGGLFLATRGPRDEACATLAESEAKLRWELTSPSTLVPLLTAALACAIQLSLFVVLVRLVVHFAVR
jgi:hypothetical protein